MILGREEMYQLLRHRGRWEVYNNTVEHDKVVMDLLNANFFPYQCTEAVVPYGADSFGCTQYEGYSPWFPELGLHEGMPRYNIWLKRNSDTDIKITHVSRVY